MTARTRLAPLAAVALLLSSVAPSRAAPSPPATAPSAGPASEASASGLFVQGNVAFAHGDYAAAEKEYREAIDVNPRLPGLWRNLGQTLDAEQRYQDALIAYGKYLDLAPLGEFAPEVKERVLKDRRLLGIAPPENTPSGQGALRISVPTDGVQILVDGLLRGASPAPPMAVVPGPHIVRLDKPGCNPFEQAIDVAQDEMVTLEHTMAPAGCGAPQESAGSATGPAGAALRVSGLPVGSIVQVDGKVVPQGSDVIVAPGPHVVSIRAPGLERYQETVHVTEGARREVQPELRSAADLASRRRWGEITLATAAAAAAFGAVFGIAESSTHQQAADEALQAMLAKTSGGATRADLASLAARGHEQATLAYVGYGVGAAALATSIVLLVSSREQADQPIGSEDASDRLVLAPSLAPGSLGLSITGPLGLGAGGASR